MLTTTPCRIATARLGPDLVCAPALSRASSSGSGTTRSADASARLVPSSQIASVTITSSPMPSPLVSEPQVPTRTKLRAPSSASSEITIAALGPPIPVLWIVNGRPSRIASPVYPQRPRLWLNIFGAVSSGWASASARPGSPGSSTRSASGAVAWM